MKNPQNNYILSIKTTPCNTANECCFFPIPGCLSSKGSGSALWYSSVSFSTSSEILKITAHQNIETVYFPKSQSLYMSKSHNSTYLVRMLTSSCVLPCCWVSHCSSKAVSSALESTLADADAILQPGIGMTFILTVSIHSICAIFILFFTIKPRLLCKSCDPQHKTYVYDHKSISQTAHVSPTRFRAF